MSAREQQISKESLEEIGGVSALISTRVPLVQVLEHIVIPDFFNTKVFSSNRGKDPPPTKNVLPAVCPHINELVAKNTK